jgi:hypothetical protein
MVGRGFPSGIPRAARFATGTMSSMPTLSIRAFRSFNQHIARVEAPSLCSRELRPPLRPRSTFDTSGVNGYASIFGQS